ncbi:ATP-binding protein [Chryseobacterium sp. MDT2-18]|uniref:ATP-binding protein n=1 Tax=Chryseobacterium sp. MDT2-18 TaxID=1259136 RepID=UPI002789FBEE|nr:ATP-binding protein [Chryseobacterium sp. MDT2-18]MDQ0477096.1 adenylate kinase [Chryseobacterium sp. MDT2-18]
MKNIIFIGGIHGSGKGRICEDLKNEIDLIHLTASEVLNWKELSSQEEKQVNDINQTQDRLISNLNKIVKEDKTYLLDGHYCLLNKDGYPEKIPIQTFKDINPMKLILVTADPKIIKERLENRDAKSYNIRLIGDFQNLEINYAKELSHILQSPIHIIDSEQFNIETLLNFLNN